MDDNAEFIAQWKPIHEKAIVKYVLLESLIYFLCTALVTIMFLWLYPSLNIKNQASNEYGVYFIILLNILTFFIFTVWRSINWISGEKRYRKIIKKEY